MNFYYDGVDANQIDYLGSTGVISGVTTNLTFVNEVRKKLGVDRDAVMHPIVEACKKYHLPLSIQVEANDPDGIVNEGQALSMAYKFLPEIFIKVPVNYKNLVAIQKLEKSGVSVNATCLTSGLQALLAAEAGARIISLFWGKMTDQGINPEDHVRFVKNQIAKSNKSVDAKILIGSFRQTETIFRAFNAGADICKVPYPMFEKMANQLQSEEANQIFQQSIPK